MKKFLLLACFVAFGASCMAMEEKSGSLDISFDLLLEDTNECKDRICEHYKKTIKKNVFKRFFSGRKSICEKLAVLIRKAEKETPEMSNKEFQNLWNIYHALCDEKKLNSYKKQLTGVSIIEITIPAEELIK